MSSTSLGRIALLAAAWALAIWACSAPATDPTPLPPSSPPAVTAATSEPGPVAAAATSAATPDLTVSPLTWFGPLPPMTVDAGRPFIGSEDFMDLFQQGSAWENAASHVQVFKLYGEWVAYNASDAQLQQAADDIRSRGMALAVEAGPLNTTVDCGQGVEGFAGTDEGLLIARRLQQAGGKLDFIALDEPYFFAHVYDGPNACHWPLSRIAEGVAQYVQLMRSEYPAVRIGDTEPLAASTTPEEYRDWLAGYRQVAGDDLEFLHIDVDWSRPRWEKEVVALEAYGDELHIPIGIIYNGNAVDPDDGTWIGITGERIKSHEAAGGDPDHILFQSWNDHPDFVLPESEASTFTGLIRTYFEDRESLGFQRSGPNANLAFHAAIRASNSDEEHPPVDAVDGDTGTWWSAGAGPAQWIEIDMAQPLVILEVRLIPSQYPEGDTVHRLLGRGPGTDSEWTLLHTFSQMTVDGEQIAASPAAEADWSGIQELRVVTDSSPSWVAWREIEVYGSP